jgi:hypothetical protein
MGAGIVRSITKMYLSREEQNCRGEKQIAKFSADYKGMKEPQIAKI